MQKTGNKYVPKALRQMVKGSHGRLIWSKVDGVEWVTDAIFMVRVPVITEIDVRVELFRKFERMVGEGETLSYFAGDIKESEIDLYQAWKPEEATVEGKITPLRWDDKRICAFPNGVLITLDDAYVRLATNDRCWSRAQSGNDYVYFGDDDGRYIVAAPRHVSDADVGKHIRRLITVRANADEN